jgi:cob(I)alamin adenosyltransferase
LERFEVVIFDNINFELISKYALISYITSKPENQELILHTTSKEIYKEFEPHAQLVTEYVHKTKKEQTLTSKKNLVCITGNGKGKSTWSFGYLFHQYLSKKDVKLIYFDKGGNYYGERIFFQALKKWSKEHPLYGTFDFVATGKERFNGQTFRFENTQDDITEAKAGLELLNTTLKKQTPIVADELNTIVKTGLVKLNEVLKVLENVENELIITGRFAPKEILDKSNIIIETKEIKHYAKKGLGVKSGIDF